MVWFYVLSLAFSWPAMLIWRLPENFQVGDVNAARQAYGQVALFFGFGPMVAALVVAFAFRRFSGLRELLSGVGRVRLSPTFYLIPLVLPVVAQWAGVGVWSAITGEHTGFPGFGSWVTRWLQLALIHAVFSVGEELGWRGFMLPRVLASRGWLSASVGVGVPWAVWHYPLWFAGSWAATGSTSQTVLILVLASATGIAVSVIATWLFVRTGKSVIPAMLLHGSVNANMNLISEGVGDHILTRLDFIASTTALMLCAAALVVAIALWRERRHADPSQVAASL